MSQAVIHPPGSFGKRQPAFAIQALTNAVIGRAHAVVTTGINEGVGKSVLQTPSLATQQVHSWVNLNTYLVDFGPAMEEGQSPVVQVPQQVRDYLDAEHEKDRRNMLMAGLRAALGFRSGRVRSSEERYRLVLARTEEAMRRSGE